MGSAAYDLCGVAAGFLDGYWELGLKLWDVCAGVLIVQEAGGHIESFREDRGYRHTGRKCWNRGENERVYKLKGAGKSL